MGNEDDVKTLLIGMARMEAKMEQLQESNQQLSERVTELEAAINKFTGSKAALLWVLGGIGAIILTIGSWLLGRGSN